MKDSDKQEILKLLKDNDSSNVFNGNITEWLFRGLLALLLFLGNNIRIEQEKQGEDLQDVKMSILHIKKENEYYGKDVETFRNVLAKPRFTKEDFDQNISPIVKQLNSNTTELNNRNSFMSDTEKRITKLEYQILELIEFKKR